MAQAPQSYQNHARIDPAYHYALTALLLLSIVVSIVASVRHPGLETTALLLLSIGFALNSAITRMYPLKVQDRIIRLEESLRLTALLPAAEKGCVTELTAKQLVALRFASDAELPGLAMRALHENLSNKQIKTSIQAWRPDSLRV